MRHFRKKLQGLGRTEGGAAPSSRLDACELHNIRAEVEEMLVASRPLPIHKDLHRLAPFTQVTLLLLLPPPSSLLSQFGCMRARCGTAAASGCSTIRSCLLRRSKSREGSTSCPPSECCGRSPPWPTLASARASWLPLRSYPLSAHSCTHAHAPTPHMCQHTQAEVVNGSEHDIVGSMLHFLSGEHAKLRCVCLLKVGGCMRSCWWLVVGGWWLVVGGWWLVVGGWWGKPSG